MGKKVALHNLGCKVNAYETEGMAELLQKAGYTIVPFEEQADIYIVNTCTVTNIADRKSRQMLHKAKKLNPDALIVAVGCYVQALRKQQDWEQQEAKLKAEGIQLLVGNDQKNQIVELIETGMNQIEDVNDTKVERKFEEIGIETMEDHTRAYMKIQDGCNQFCTYCLIPYARGRVRSRKIEHIEEEAMRLMAAGYQEIVLTGIHLSSYGMDVQDGTTLLDVLKRLGRIPKLKRIRLGSLEPRIITEEFLSELVKIESFCPQFHLSLQSGCEATLKRMNRKYTPQEYLRGCERIRHYFPEAGITTDVIVGFPGETEEEFQTTMDFVKQVKFSRIHVFKYSKREGTMAAVMEHQVPEHVKTVRSNLLMQQEEAMRVEYMEQFMGKIKEVLIEEQMELQGVQYWVGHTREYMKVAFADCGEIRENQMVSGRILGRLNTEIVLAEK